jgi:hypothetical protein
MFAINNLRKAINTLNDHYRWNNDYNELGKVVKKHQTAGYKKVSKCKLNLRLASQTTYRKKKSSIFFLSLRKNVKKSSKDIPSSFNFLFPEKNELKLASEIP